MRFSEIRFRRREQMGDSDCEDGKERDDLVCPFCERKLEKLVEVKKGFFETNRVFCCPHCHKIVGMSAGN